MELHILFFILAGLLIAVLVGSSIWSHRREKSRIFSNTFSTRPPSTPIQSAAQTEVPKTLDPQSYHDQNYVSQPDVEVNTSAEIQQDVESSLNSIKIKLPGEETAQLEPQMSPYQAQVQSSTPVYSQQTAPAFVEVTPQPEPVEVRMEEPAAQPTVETPPNMMMLYVVAAEGQVFYGDYLAQCLEGLGFQYGEYQIFHRHQHIGNNATPVIFSVANMMQPGIFDLEKMDRFSTIGLVMFMHLPSEGNDVANLKLMLQSAERLAQSLGGFVLNDRREIFDENSRLEYLNRLR